MSWSIGESAVVDRTVPVELPGDRDEERSRATHRKDPAHAGGFGRTEAACAGVVNAIAGVKGSAEPADACGERRSENAEKTDA